MSETAKKESCGCFVARHPEAGAIDAAILANEDPRRIAERFDVGKSKVYEHRRHLLDGAPPAPSPPPADDASARSTTVPRDSMERGAPFHGTVESAPRARPQVAEIARGTPFHGTGAGYAQAVEACVALITTAQWRADRVGAISQRFDITVPRARQAYSEATRTLRMNMGGYLERLEVSVAWVTQQRDEARKKADAREKVAEDWRRKEREAHDVAEKLDGEDRIAALEGAARLGMIAAKYGLEAEKWAAQALAHQRHLDDIQCLRGPRELNLTQNNLGDGAAMLERFGSELARRFAGRPDVLREIEAAATVIGQSEDGAIDVPGEAA